MVMNHGVAGRIFIVGSMVAMRCLCLCLNARVGHGNYGALGQSSMRHRRRFNAAKCQSNR